MAIEPSWLEARFADIANRVEQSLVAHNPHNALLAIGARFDQFEQRFDRALHDIGGRPGGDQEALKSVEQQIGELAAQFERTQGQLARLDAIESRLTDLRQNLSDEQMSRLMGALAPADEKLSAMAKTAAEHVANALRSETPAERTAPAMASDPRLVELTTMLDAFIGEQKQGDAQTADALDTMQQAMQHLIDRVEAIEAAQISNHEALIRERVAVEPREPQIFTVRTSDPIVNPPEISEPPPIEPPPGREPPSDITEPLQAWEPLDELRAPTPPDALPTPPSPANGELDRLAMIAMARRAADKVSNEAPPVPRKRAGSSLLRPSVLLVASFAAFLLAGFWLFAGPSLRGLIPSFGLADTRSGDAARAIVAPAQAADTPRDRPSNSPLVGRTAEQDAAPDGDDARPAGQVQRASLSTPVALPSAPRTVVTTTTGDLAGALSQSASEPASPSTPPKPEMPAMSRAVELPPAMLGPLSLRRAAAKGDPRAQFEVAARYAEGKGIPRDFGQAATWYQRAAAQGLAPAQYRLGALYERGLGVNADPARARVWYSRAAEQGNLRAMHNLAVLSAGRPGIQPDYPSAVQWFTEAADRGLADSQYNLGILYESGLGVPANNIEAYKWYALAARSGDKDATKRRDIVRNKLDARSVRAADALVIQWRAKAVENEANNTRIPGQTWQAVRQ
jgi:localization factor PodJL